jgi:L-threonylcarbamoyladenylate synthase
MLNAEEISVARQVRSGEIAVIPTDTIYGLIASAFCESGVEEVYTLRNRDSDKPCIVLFQKQEELSDFVDKSILSRYSDVLSVLWPGEVSIVLPVISCSQEWAYLHRGKKSLAFRMPRDAWLTDFLSLSGPIIAPSANMQGKDPIRRGDQAQAMFGKKVSLILDHGLLERQPSTLISFVRNDILVLREGAVSRTTIESMVSNRYCVK